VLVQTAPQAGRTETDECFTVVAVAHPAARRWRQALALWRPVRRVARAVEAERPDVVVLEGATWAPYHWLLLRRLRRTLPKATIVYHSHNVEYELRRQKHGRLVRGVTRWAEGAVLKGCDLCFAVSEVDREQLRRLYGVETQLLPNGVDVDRFAGVTDTAVTEAKRLYGIADQSVLFMGPYYYRPNREAIDFLIYEVFPRILKTCPQARLLVLGGPIPYRRPWLVNPGLIPYDQIPAVVRSCRVGVAPIFSGSGTRLKILEYLAAGRPVVSTAKGAEGLRVQSGHNILIAEDAEAFADAVALLMSDDARADELGRRGCELVRNCYDWPETTRKMNELLELACANGTLGALNARAHEKALGDDVRLSS